MATVLYVAALAAGVAYLHHRHDSIRWEQRRTVAARHRSDRWF